MAQKKITELQLISEITGSENFPLDDGIQTYRATMAQVKEWVERPRHFPSYQAYLSGSGTFNLHYSFEVTAASATVGATYTNNSVTFTVVKTVASAGLVVMSGSGAPTASGTLTKASGTGDATIGFDYVRAPLYLRVQVVGGGGGGAGGGSGPSGAGSGGVTSFGTTLLVGNGGGQGVNQGGGGAGATGSIGAGVDGQAITGGGGGGAHNSGTVCFTSGGAGGDSYFGGGGGSSINVAGYAAAGNSGSGGGGGGAAPAGGGSGGGGGAGGFAEGIIWSPSATYAYEVGAGGTAGGAGSNGLAGATGGEGIVKIWCHYQ